VGVGDPESLPIGLDPVVSSAGETISFDWGRASWVIDGHGDRHGLVFADPPFESTLRRGKRVLGSIKEYLLGDYEESIAHNAKSTDSIDETVARVTRAREAAYTIKKLLDVAKTLPYTERPPLRYFIEETIKKINKEAGVNIFKKIIIP
jgi:hypothetical protein